MRIVKLALLSFVILFLIVTAFSLLIPGNISLSKATNISADDTIIYTYIERLPEWKHWHPALKNLPDSDIQFSPERINVHGTVIKVLERKPEELVTEIRQGEGSPIANILKIVRHQAQDSATLQWRMNFELRWYPWEKFRSLFYENFYGVQMEQGLANLKELSQGRRSSIN